MNKTKKTIILIAIFHIVSLFIVTLISKLNTEAFLEDYAKTMDYGSPLIAGMPLFIGEFIHLSIMILIALIVKLRKNIDKNVKKVVYILPILTIILQLPIAVLVFRIL
jgi:amino acid permease